MQNQRVTISGLIVWLVCAIFFTYEFLLRTVLGTFQHPIMYDLDLTPMKFAILSTTAYMLVYGLLQMPVGLITDRFGLKKTLAFASVVCAISAVAFAFTYEFKSAVLARMLMGFGSSFGFICLLVAVYDWMPPKNYGLFIGLSQFVGTMGPMLAAGPLHDVAQNGSIDWRSIFIGLSVFGCIILFFVLLLVRNNKDKVSKFVIINKPLPVMLNITSILKQKQTWLIAVYSALVYFTLEYLSENEGKIYLELQGFKPSFAAYMITIGWIGYAIGCPLLGVLSDYFKRRKTIMVLAAILCLVSVSLIVYFPISKAVLVCAFFLLGIGASGQSVGFAIMAEQCNKYYLAAGLGFNNAVIGFLCSINAPVIGLLLDHHSQHNQPGIGDYTFAFSFIVGLLVLAVFISAFFIKETFCRSNKAFTVIKAKY